MSNSRSFRRSLKTSRHVRSSGPVHQKPRRQPWNKGLALTSRPHLETVRRWLEAAVTEGTIERKGVERTGKPGRPPVLYGLTEASLEKAKKQPSIPPGGYLEQVRRHENARKRRRMQRDIQRLKVAEEKAAKAGRKVTATAAALEQAETEGRRLAAKVLALEITIRAIKAAEDAGGDFSVLLPEEIDTLTEIGILTEKDGRLLLAQHCTEAFDRICNEQAGAPA